MQNRKKITSDLHSQTTYNTSSGFSSVRDLKTLKVVKTHYNTHTEELHIVGQNKHKHKVLSIDTGKNLVKGYTCPI